MEEVVSVNRVDEIRRAGLYLGPVILGSVVGNGLYGVACGSRSFVAGTSAQPLALTFAFVIGAVILAWRFKEPLARVAMLIFAVHHGLLTYASISGAGLNSVTMTVLIAVFAALLTASGARDGTARRFVIAGSGFVAMVVFSFGARYYADVLLGNHSVLSGPIC
jgi:hypothetical protein